MINEYLQLFFTDNDRKILKDNAEREYDTYAKSLGKDITITSIETLERLIEAKNIAGKNWQEKGDRFFDLGGQIAKWLVENEINSIKALYNKQVFLITQKPGIWNIEVRSV